MRGPTWNDIAWLQVVWVFGWALFAALIWYLATRRKDRQVEMMHKERLLAMEKGIPLSELPDLPAVEPKVSAGMSWWSEVRLNPRWPLGVGAILVCLGAGVTFALVQSHEDYHNRVWSFGMIPVFLGIGLWLHYWIVNPKGK